MMMKKDYHILLSAVFAALVCMSACRKLDSEPVMPAPEDGMAEYVVDVSGLVPDEGTRSILGSDTSADPFIKDSGYQVFAFNRRAGLLESIATSDSFKSAVTLSLSTKDTYDFYVVGNLWFISSGKKTGWDSYFKKVNRYPAKASDMENFSLMPFYRFDGQTVGSTGLRTETFAEVGIYGIPYSGKVEGVNYANSRSGIPVIVNKLFSKVTLTVDHSGLVSAGSVDAFVNKSIHLRQVNCRVHPFIEGIAAASGDILSSAEDYESSPVNGASETFVFYVPENYGGSYSVSSPSQKTPSKAGSKSGLVTYLEFVGKLDPAKAGGYGGTLTYQFCLGENATTSYDVKRNSNYKVTLGFKPESLFKEVEWKLDKGEDFTDTRVFGLSADAAGAQRLATDGSQVIAVRPANSESKKKELYVFFNHNGGAANEVGTYVDKYTDGYKPADATRSAVKITCPAMDADGIKYSYDAATGKVSFWTDSPSGFTPGHEYDVMFTLYPGGKTVSAKIKTVGDLGVTTNFADMFVGMKRSLATKGFLGSNITLKVTSGGENILRYSNSAASDGGPGTDKYVTKQGVTLGSTSMPLYAYRPGSVTLAVSSEDSFNDGTFPFTVNVKKPDPCYDDIKGDTPLWNPVENEVYYGFAVIVPLDGTPVDIPAYYVSDPWYPESSRITIGAGENQFDQDVYNQLLAFTFDFTSECLARDPNTMKIYIKKWKASNGKYFGVFGDFNWNFIQRAVGCPILPSQVTVRPRATDIFPEGENEKIVVVDTIIPGFYDYTEREGNAWKKLDWKDASLTSNYFNAWSSDWSAWKTNAEIDTDVLKAQWPKITNEIGFTLAGCRPASISFDCFGDHDATLPQVNDFLNKGFDGTGDFITFKWRFAPGETTDGITDTKGAAAPYGKQKLQVKVYNVHSGEVFELNSPEFDIKYENVKLAGYLFGYDGEERAQYYAAAPSVLGWILYEKSLQPYFDPYEHATTMPNPLYAFDDNYIVCDTPTDLVEYGGINNVQYTEHRTAMTEIHAKFPAWKRDGGYPSRIGDYDDATWNAELMQWWLGSDFAMPRRYAFTKEGIRRSDIQRDWYSNEDLYDYVRFSYDKVNVDDELKRLGYNIY